MKPNDIVGLIKFFRDEGHLDSLVNGKLYCNSPEYYRRHNGEGVGDAHESASLTYRDGRDDQEPEVYIAGKRVDGVLAYTIRNTGLADRWLYCWTTLELPEDDKGWEALAHDYARLRREFGEHYAYVQPPRVSPFVERLRTLTNHELGFYKVDYTDNLQLQGPTAKRTEYAYQREARFLIGECDDSTLEPLVMDDPEGFGTWVEKSPAIKITNTETEEIAFELSYQEGLRLFGKKID